MRFQRSELFGLVNFFFFNLRHLVVSETYELSIVFRLKCCLLVLYSFHMRITLNLFYKVGSDLPGVLHCKQILYIRNIKKFGLLINDRSANTIIARLRWYRLFCGSRKGQKFNFKLHIDI